MNIIRILKSSLKKLAHLIEMKVMKIAVISQFTSSLYWLIRGGFGREHHAVLAGRVAYFDSLTNSAINTSLLRRNIHRLEKGMLMRPRRIPFALDYIEETVVAYVNAIQVNTEPAEIAWAYDVLTEYMAIMPAHPRVDYLRSLIVGSQPPNLNNMDEQKKRIPYIRNESHIPNISYEEILKLAKYRRSVRWYTSKIVPREMINKAIEVAAYSPSACNRLPYVFKIFDDPDLISKIIKLPAGTSGWSSNVPVLAVIVGKQRNYFGQHDRHCIYTDASLAIMSFVYALEVQGLGSCCINWPDIEIREKQMQYLLRLEPDERPVMLVAFGWPDPEGMVACSTKKSVDTLCKYNWEN